MSVEPWNVFVQIRLTDLMNVTTLAGIARGIYSHGLTDEVQAFLKEAIEYGAEESRIRATAIINEHAVQ